MIFGPMIVVGGQQASTRSVRPCTRCDQASIVFSYQWLLGLIAVLYWWGATVSCGLEVRCVYTHLRHGRSIIRYERSRRRLFILELNICG